MTTNHTFGPWRKAAGIVSNPRVIVEDESGLTVCALSLRGALGDINRMNARADLIAAAPELLEALSVLYAVAAEQLGDDWAAVTNAAAVIAKARGAQ